MRNYNVDIEMVKELEDKCVQIRKDLLRFGYSIGEAHMGGELSVVEMCVALFYKYMNYDVMQPKWEDRDRLILSKAHCSQTLYTIYADLGAYTTEYMLEHFQTLETAKFCFHSNSAYCPQTEFSTGSLGHGLSVGVGMALGARMQRKNWRTFVITGDGELDEGSNWEAMMAAGHYQLGNLVAICDKNGISMTGLTKEVMNQDPLDEKIRAFGWDVRVINGNNMYEVCEVLQSLPPADPDYRRKPIFIISNTVKGKGVDFMEGVYKYHSIKVTQEIIDRAIVSVEKNRRVR